MAEALGSQLNAREVVEKPGWLPAAPAMFLILWSLGFPIAKIGIEYADPIALLMLRYALVLVILVPLIFLVRPPWPSRTIDWLHLAVVGFLIQGVYFGLCYAAFSLCVSAGMVALVVSLQPVLVAVLAPVLIGETISVTRWVGLACGFAGAVIVITGYETIGVTSVIGITCSVGALFGMVVATLYEKRFGVHQHPITANFVQYTVGLIATVPLVLLFHQHHVIWAEKFVACLAYLVIGNSIIAITLLLTMIRHGQASRVSALFYLVPPCAAGFAWLLIGDKMPLLAWVGMAVAAMGVSLVSWSGQR